MNQFLSAHRPPLLIFENVDSIADAVHDTGSALLAGTKPSSDMDVAMSQWASLGYECQRSMVNSREFGIPASRNRLLVIGFQTMTNAAFDFSQRSLSCVFSTMR